MDRFIYPFGPFQRGDSTNRGGVALIVVPVTVVTFGVVLLAALVAVLTPLPPVNVFTSPAPLANETPQSLMPDRVANSTRIELGSHTDTHVIWSNGSYDRGIQIEITKWDNLSLAASYLDQGRRLFADLGDLTAVSRGEQHWFTHDGDAESVFAWRRGIWVFDVRAPNRGLRNQVAEELALGKSFPGDLSMMPEIEAFDFTLGLTMSVAYRGLQF